MKEVQQCINSRPLGVCKPNEEPTAYNILTANHILMGRASCDIPSGPFSDNRLTKRFTFIQNTVPKKGVGQGKMLPCPYHSFYK